MVDTSWEIHTGDNSRIFADAVLTDPANLNVITRGESATYVFTNILKTLVVESGDTYIISNGETERYDVVVVDGTLVVDGIVETERIEINGTVTGDGTVDLDEAFAFDLADVEPYSKYAGTFSLNSTLDNTQRYNERTPTNAEIDTLLVGIEPAERLKDKTINGYWGLIQNISDNRNRPLSNNRVEIEIAVLAPYDEYDDHTEVQNDLEITL
jgi:hypothetical protein